MKTSSHQSSRDAKVCNVVPQSVSANSPPNGISAPDRVRHVRQHKLKKTFAATLDGDATNIVHV